MNRAARRGLTMLGLAISVGAILFVRSLLPIGLRTSPIGAVGVVLLGVMIVTYWVRQDWRFLDEFHREAHKMAGLWGLTYGMVGGWCGIGICSDLFIPPKLRIADFAAMAHGQLPQQPLILMMLGALIVILTALAGYVITLVVWRLRNSVDHAIASN